ncbi:DUF4118 domain-containing protein [Streptomyces sp. NPDC096012]|uniref:DUF4118 domain-containing protein n=1 Tax=Streptomyces sp. NPDC096012 TaxID=3155684 RepID=UPI00336AE246
MSSAAWFDFFLTRPYQSFSIKRGADITTAVLLLAVGLAVSQLATRARRLEALVVTDADCLARVHDTARLAQTSRFADAVVDHVKRQLTELLQLRECRFEYGSLLGHPARLKQDGSVTAGRKPEIPSGRTSGGPRAFARAVRPGGGPGRAQRAQGDDRGAAGR